MSSQALEHFVLYDSDANPISSHLADEGECTVTWLGEAVLDHARLSPEPLRLVREMISPDNVEWYRGPEAS